MPGLQSSPLSLTSKRGHSEYAERTPLRFMLEGKGPEWKMGFQAMANVPVQEPCPETDQRRPASVRVALSSRTPELNIVQKDRVPAKTHNENVRRLGVF